MKLLTTILLFLSLNSNAQFILAKKVEYIAGYSLVTVHWRQISLYGNSTCTIVSPDSTTTKVLNINRAGIYKFEFAVTYVRAGVTTVAKDTVQVTANPPVKDSVFTIQKFTTSKSIEIVSRVQSTANIKVYNGTAIIQNYNVTAYSGVVIRFVTGICGTCVLKVTLNGKVWTL